MSEQTSVNLDADPRVQKAVNRLSKIVPEANLSHIVRAALLYLAEGVPDHQISVYIQEQINLE